MKIQTTLPALLCALALAFIPGCQAKRAGNPDPSALRVAQSLLFRMSGYGEATLLTRHSDKFDEYLTDVYGLDASRVEDGIILCPSGMQAREIAILCLSNPGTAKSARTTLRDYVTSRQAAFTGYAPEQAQLLSQARVALHGRYLLLLICPDASDVESTAVRYLNQAIGDENSRPDQTEFLVQPNETGDTIITDQRGYELYLSPWEEEPLLFDTSPLKTAWDSGDESLLSEEDRALLQTCRQAVKEVIKPGMSDCEKELAIHDWILQWADYAEDTLTPLGQTTQRDLTPYGILLDREGTCMGYANTFQLFMDLLDIPCRTVTGASFHSMQAHGWNMVQLQGEWYCVDVTWDDSLGKKTIASGNWSQEEIDEHRHRYFNVTSDYLRATGHQWDYDRVPEATATRCAWSPLIAWAGSQWGSAAD